MTANSKRLVIVQYGGDYRKTIQTINSTGIETYHAQKYVVENMIAMSQKVEEVILVCCQTQDRYNEVVYPGIRTIGGALDPFQESQLLCQIIAEQKPTHLVIHSPIPSLFNWAIKKQVKTLGLLADSFLKTGLRRKIKSYLLANLFNNKNVEWVGNHGINSCLSLQSIGVNPNKIIPWDWHHDLTPDRYPPKKLPNKDVFNLVYVGALAKTKGVGEILEAIAILKQQKISVNLQLAGGGDTNYFINQAEDLKITENVQFLGLVPHQKVIDLMRQGDLVIVPSWHEYPEGFPLTIYEAFCARTPLIASDHPMFRGNLQDGVNAMIFPATNSPALAASISKLLSQPELYYNLSDAAADAWQQLQIPVKWADLITAWVDGSSDSLNWLYKHRLNSGLYDHKFRGVHLRSG
jgi:glycosyltransferase involved in cell wall biosynthesis